MCSDFTYTPEDLREASRISRRMAKTARQSSSTGRRLAPGRGIVGWVIFVGLALLIVYLQTHKRVAQATPASASQATSIVDPLIDMLMPFIPYFVMLTFLYVVVFRGVRQRRAKQQQAMTVPMEMGVTADGVVLVNGPVETRWQWLAFKRFAESDRQFLLELESGGGWVAVPKRLATGDEELAELRELIESNVHPRMDAFPVQTI